MGNLFSIFIIFIKSRIRGWEVGKLEREGFGKSYYHYISPLSFTGEDLKEKLNNSQRRKK